MEGMVVGSGPTAYMCNLPIKKKEKENGSITYSCHRNFMNVKP
jgi:hypothetical protein